VRELALEPLRALEVAVDREVLEEVVEAAEPLRRADDGRLSARVDQEARREPHLAAVDAPRVDDRRRVAGVDARDRVLLVHLDAVVARVVEQELVELGADDLIAVRTAARIFAEEEAPRLGLTAPLERAAGLPEEPVLVDRIRRADRVEDRQRRR